PFTPGSARDVGDLGPGAAPHRSRIPLPLSPWGRGPPVVTRASASHPGFCSRSLIHQFPRLQLAEPDVAPLHLVRPRALLDAVDRESDEPGGVDIVGEVGGGDAVKPGAIAVALDDDPVMIPALVLEGARRCRLRLVEPAAAAALVVEPARRAGLV